MPIKVKMTIFMKEKCGYVDDIIELDLEFKVFKSFKRFCKKLNDRLNGKRRKFVSIGYGKEAFTIRIEDIESIAYKIERI